MTQNVIDRLDLFMSIDSDDCDHDVPETFFPAPKYFVRTAEKTSKVVLLLHAMTDCDDEQHDDCHLQYVSSLKTAMGKELSESCEKQQWTASKSQRANDEWDLILDLDPI